MRNLLLFAIAAAPLLASCTTYSSWSSTPSRIILNEKSFEDGSKTEYRLVFSALDDVAIHRDDTAIVELPFLGLSVSSINAEVAKTYGAEPWTGVVITSVTANSAAAKAELGVGDILLAINDQPLGSDGQFFETVQGYAPGETLQLLVLSREKGVPGRSERLVSATLGSREVEEASTTRIPVEADGFVFRHTGLVTAAIPGDLSATLYGSESPAVLIAAVTQGCDAYKEGFRSGDRILRCNGLDVTSLDQVIDAAGPQRGQMELEVQGPLGAHSGTFDLEENVVVARDFDIPIVLDYSSSVGKTRTSFLDFIFQFGFNYRRSALSAPTTREPQWSSYLSILPLGMFEFTRRPGYRKNRIFWLIKWSSRSRG